MVIEAELTCGASAAARLAPHDPGISDNFETPAHIGALIAAWDKPQFVLAEDATHMRDDDYVVGIEHKGCYRAYPLWITDNYHVVNDRIAGEPVVFATCERCQSGSAFVSLLDGRSVKFSAKGMYNASLVMVDRMRGLLKPSSLWLHYEGVAIDGPARGSFLEQIPSYHMSWEEWATAHPETDVMLPPDDPHHRDARHGHGREEYFSRPGMDPPLAVTITGAFDHQYPENELVLGINVNAGIRAYPLLEVKRHGGVVNDELGEIPIVVFSGPRPDQITLAVFSRVMDNLVLDFEMGQDCFHDRQTGSTWTIDGRARVGELAGRRLTPLRWQYVRWHAWVYPHPGTELFRCPKPLPRYPDFPDYPQVEALRDVLDAVVSLAPDLVFSHVIPALGLPQEAEHGVCIQAGSDRLNLYAFTSAASAQDYAALQGAWFCKPFGARFARKRCLRLGRHVLVSDPTRQYAEPTQTIRYPDNETPWSGLVCDPDSTQTLTDSFCPGESVEGHFMDLIRFLRKRRYDIVECAFLPRSQQRVGTLSAMAATIEADRFAVYRCPDESTAAAVSEELGRAIHAGPWVFRSIPVLMYADPHFEMVQLPDEEIRWSPLLHDERFRTTLANYVNRRNKPQAMISEYGGIN